MVVKEITNFLDDETYVCDVFIADNEEKIISMSFNHGVQFSRDTLTKKSVRLCNFWEDY